MIDAFLVWTSVLTTGGACAGAIFPITQNAKVADSASLILLGMGLFCAAHFVRRQSRDAAQY